jgi:hypothetical protein
MDRLPKSMFHFVLLSLVLVAGVIAAIGQTPASTPPPLPPGMTGSNTSDPRFKLTPGLYDAGETAMGLKHVDFLKKPDAFQLGTSDPTDPRVNNTLQRILGVPDPSQLPADRKMVLSQLAFANSDLAFQGKHLFQGNFYGVSIYDISDPAKTKLLTTMVCPGGQGDVSVYGDLMFMSVEMANGRVDCGTGGFPPPAAGQAHPAADPARFRGVRIFDISDILHPKQVAAIQTCRGSHTHTLVLDPNDPNNVYVYVSETSFVRPNEELTGCSGDQPSTNPNTALFKIDVIKVPVKNPSQAKIVNSPRIFMDPNNGGIAGISSAAEHGTGKPRPTDQCHDITAYPEIGLAAGACEGNGILLDIRDPANPKRIDAVNDPNYSYWHSATFSNDGKKVVFTDEWGGGLGARCRPTDPNVWGADSIFTIDNNKLHFQSYYKMPAAQTDTENCVAHNGSLIPVPGRDIMVQAWYQGGVSLMDFTDPKNVHEIAYFDRGPIDPNSLVLGGSWSAYWYNGHIYSSEIARGLDVFDLTPSKFLTQNEIDAARSVHVAELNVQDQQRINWPKNRAAGLAYIDQLERTHAFTADQLAELRKAVKADKLTPSDLSKMKTILESAASAATTADSRRMHTLEEIIVNPTL